MLNVELTLAHEVPLASLTTLGAGGTARYFFEARSEIELQAALAWADGRGVRTYVLGGGSNVVIADAGVDGLVVRVALRGVTVSERSDGVDVSAAAGEPWDDLVRFSVERGYAGIECLSGIPGLVGATPIQNVGAYGQDVSQTIVAVRALERASSSIVELTNAECGFRYRDSMFKSRWRDAYVVSSVTYRLKRGSSATVAYPDLQRELERRSVSEPSLSDVRNAVLAVRRSKSMVLDPSDPNTRSCGSFFLNPIVDEAVLERIRRNARSAALPHWPQSDGNVKLSAAWLIEHAGFRKGHRFGNAAISERHSLALVCREGERSCDVVELAALIRARVSELFGITLVPEPSFWGFPPLQNDQSPS